jgi:hypothetical protein
MAFHTLVLYTILLLRSVAAQTCTPCDDVHFFLARGNNEPYPGRQAALVEATCNGIASCGYENLIYSALFTDLYCQTAYDGVIAGLTQLTAYADNCPNSKLILAGYSQGAQIVTDILGGGGGISFNGCVQPDTASLDRTASPGNRLCAVITFGNTRHTANQPYNYGNGSDLDGVFPRSGAQISGIADYTNITRDWCLSTDPICAANQAISYVSTHLGYYNLYAQEAAAWVRSVVSMSTDSNFQTVIPISVSGTVQDYATVGTATPSGTVTTAAITTAVVHCGSSTVSSSGNGTVSSSGSSTISSSASSAVSSTKVTSSSPATETPSVTSETTSGLAASSAASAIASKSAGARNQASHNLSIILLLGLAVYISMLQTL